MRRQGIPIPGEGMISDRKRILIVDDDPIIVETLVQALEEEEYDYEIISASDGFEAGLQVVHFKPHLLILDIMMPDIKGYDVCKKSRVIQQLRILRSLCYPPISMMRSFKK